MAVLLWVSRNQRHLAEALRGGRLQGQPQTGRPIARQACFSLQANHKMREGSNHPDRDAQFEHINNESEAFQAEKQPALVARTRPVPLPGSKAPADHGRLRRQQRRPGPAVEMLIAKAGQ